MYDEEENNNGEEEMTEDNVCPKCGIRQYGEICQNCGTKLEEDEKEKNKDDDDEYDRRERR
jgi:DNA-directed RNA polymerase subunit RPC12/RpoP